MNYTMEDLLPVTARLADRYTSYASTSLPYEKARMLMEAVIYCIEECTGEDGNTLSAAHAPDAEGLYKRGCEIVKEKVYRAKRLYEQIIDGFDDYGCMNYRDTILKGMPSFFLYYDPVFCPQNHLLTLDYPTAGTLGHKLTGVDLIEEYLTRIALEKNFLRFFPPAAICSMLERITPDYRELYLDNICMEVLCCAVECIAAGASLSGLYLNEEQERKLCGLLKGRTMEQIKAETGCMIGKMTGQMEDEKLQSYIMGLNGQCGALIKMYIDAKVSDV